MRFDEKMGVNVLAATVLGAVVGAAGVGWLVYLALERFTPLYPSQAITPAAGAAGLAFVAIALAGLRSPKQVQVDERALRVIPYVGIPKEYDLATNQFSAFLVRQNNGQTTTRAVLVTDANGGQKRLPLALSAPSFDALLRILTDNPAQASAQYPSGASVAGPAFATPTVGAPLLFDPRVFTPSSGGLKRLGRTLVWCGLGFAVVVVVLSIILADPSLMVILLTVAVIIPMGMVPYGAYLLAKARKVPSAITVTPTAVTFGEQTFAYQDLYVLELPAPGLAANAKARLRTMAGTDHTFLLVLSDTRAFPDYDEFATLLRQAANAVKPVVNFTFSG